MSAEPTRAQAHTPVPWLLPTTNKGRLPIFIAAKDDRMKAGMVLIASVGDIANGPIDYRETAANAAFIVRCVNSHDALVAALECSLKQLDSLASCTTEAQTGLIDPRKSPAYQQARAALAQAKGAQ